MNPYIYALTGACIGLFASALWIPQSMGGIYPLPAVVEEVPQEAEILFVGDAFFDRAIRIAISEKGSDYILSCVKDVLLQPDLVVANLEGPLTDNPSVSAYSPIGSPDNFRFTFDPEIASLLYRHNIRMVNLGNNHITNFGYGGVSTTLRYLQDAGVEYFGEPDTYSVAYKTINDIPVAFVSYNEFGGDAETTISQIAEAASLGYLPVVYTHWGAEYLPISPEYIQRLARTFVDAGARLVIGSHPHVIQQSELYNGSYIYYSLGNFVFDQYFTEEVRKGLMVEVVFTKEGIASIKEIPTYLERDRRTCLKV